MIGRYNRYNEPPAPGLTRVVESEPRWSLHINNNSLPRGAWERVSTSKFPITIRAECGNEMFCPVLRIMTRPWDGRAFENARSPTRKHRWKPADESGLWKS